MELRVEDRVSEDRKKHLEYRTRQEREHKQVEFFNDRLHVLETEYENLKDEVPRLHAEIAKLRNEKIDMQERLLEKQKRYGTLLDDHVKLRADYQKQDILYQKERQTTGQLLGEMGKELAELRCYRTEHDGRSSYGSTARSPGQYTEMSGDIHQLTGKNRHLDDSSEELNAQLISQCIGEGKSLMQPAQGQSLAAELDHLTKEELLEQLKIERDVTFHLRQYVDRIIATILEKHPSLLEISYR